MRVVTAARWLYGSILLLAPAALPPLTDGRTDRYERRLARLLGARHLLQAALTGPNPSICRLYVGALVDAGHAATMLTLAKRKPGQRLLFAKSGLVATTLAAAQIGAAIRD